MDDVSRQNRVTDHQKTSILETPDGALRQGAPELDNRSILEICEEGRERCNAA
jgi:hypothetical protein